MVIDADDLDEEDVVESKKEGHYRTTEAEARLITLPRAGHFTYVEYGQLKWPSGKGLGESTSSKKDGRRPPEGVHSRQGPCAVRSAVPARSDGPLDALVDPKTSRCARGMDGGRPSNHAF